MARRVTLAEEAIRRAGFKRGGRAAAFAGWWLLAELDAGRRPTVEQYGKYFAKSEATAWRDIRQWREVFPEWDTPSEFFDVVGLDRSLAASTNLLLVPYPA